MAKINLGLKAVAIFLSLLPLLASATIGGSHSGGGDPDAIEYVKIMKEVPELIRVSPQIRALVSAEDFASLAAKYEKSLDSKSSQDHLVVFSDVPLNHEGVPKPAIFDGQRTLVYRDSWRAYGKNGLKSQKRAIVLLEGLLALGVSWGRYSSVGAIKALEIEDIETLSRILRLSAAETAFKSVCDRQIKFKDGAPGVTAHMIDFTFYWKIGEREYRLQFLENTDTFSGSLPLLHIVDIKSEKVVRENESLAHARGFAIIANSEGVKVRDGSQSTLTVKLADGTREEWDWKDGQKAALRLKTSIQSLPNYRGNSVITATKSENAEYTYAGSCVESPVSGDWKSVIGAQFLNTAVTEFEDFVESVKVAEISYEICTSERTKADCEPARELANHLISGSEAKWIKLKEKLVAKLKAQHRDQTVPRPDIERVLRVPERRMPRLEPLPSLARPIDEAERNRQHALRELDRAIKDEESRDMISEIRQLRTEIRSRRRR